MRAPAVVSWFGLLLVAAVSAQTVAPFAADKAADKWVTDTFRKMTVDDKVGQLVLSTLNANYLATDSDEFERLAHKVTALKVGGFHVFGGTAPAAALVLGQGAGSAMLGDAFATASLLNRLQTLSSVPLINTSDFETGVGFRVRGATTFPREMAVAAAGDEALAVQAASITAVEGRALGVHVDFSPVADVNDNPRNPVINTRSFGESPEAVGRFTAAYVRGLHAGGMLATLKHFPGHGDTDVDSHLGLPIIQAPRDRLDRVELVPFRAGLAAGADVVMTGHIELPALDPGDFAPASLSRPIVTGLLRGEMKFDGLVTTDAMTMEAVTAKLSAGDAAVRAIQAGNDFVLDSPDDDAAVAAIKAAVVSGAIPMAQIDASVLRILRAKARLGLFRSKTVPLDEVAKSIGGRTHALVAKAIAAKSITLVKDDRNQVPFRAPGESSVLYLSVLDYPSGWGVAAPSRTLLPELRQRWPDVTAIELSDRSSPADLDLVRATALRYDGIVVGVFVRAASGSGRMDLAPPLVRLLSDLGRLTTNTPRPFVTIVFGNPYVAASLSSLPALLVTYDFYDLAEDAAAKAILGEASIAGRLPIALPGLGDAGWGIVR